MLLTYEARCDAMHPLPSRPQMSQTVEPECPATLIASMAVIKVVELWGEGPSVEAAAEAVRAYPEERKRAYFAENVTWSVTVSRNGAGVALKLASAVMFSW